jgi:hypothetical protein
MIDGNKVWDAQEILRSEMEWMRWVEEIPYLEWPEGWLVKAVPPFSCAVIRYLITRRDIADGYRVSVYLDCYDMLGAVFSPYWEVYPGANGPHPDRCGMDDVHELMRQIQSGLDYLAGLT